MTSPADAKALLRQALRQRRKRLDGAAQASAARQLVTFIEQIPLWQQATSLAIYRPADGEIGTDPLIEKGRQLGKHIFLPVIDPDDRLRFALWETQASLQENRYGIGEPPPQAPRRALADIDILFMPLVGWDTRGGRLGMGGGFYDRCLGNTAWDKASPRPLLVGLAHDCQEIACVPREPWDVALEYVATASRLLRCAPAQPA
ncbi:MAG: 5-formyltetrahydrofolate cyclo-ligase [Halioglobus sp.]|nr:5-formyltetrahydrofolate cyclo-ligase [Halioglobus sp.]